ncbi:hypothetical protein J2X61_005159 [Bacillus sp. 3255]|nr:hypothetical protein [Bacillus sp. 3255]
MARCAAPSLTLTGRGGAGETPSLTLTATGAIEP